MNTAAFLANFPRQLRHWTFHCCLNALPSFCIALRIFQLWKSGTAMAAMFCAVATFILLYSSLTSLAGAFSVRSHILSRALRLGTKIRGWISAISLTVVFTPAMSIAPDFWCGFISAGITSLVMGDGNEMGFDLLMGGRGGFLPVYFTTLVEGFILSGILAFISFLAVMFLQWKARREFFRAAAPGQSGGGSDG